MHRHGEHANGDRPGTKPIGPAVQGISLDSRLLAYSLVCVTSESPRAPFRFRSYESLWNKTEGVTIWQACRATSAAPTFFPPIMIGNPSVSYVDDGLGYNNPIRALLDEMQHLWPDSDIGCVVSVGTGVPASLDVGRSIKPLSETLKGLPTETEQVSQEIADELEHSYPDRHIYFRFSVQRGLKSVRLEEWREMAKVKTVTEEYLRKIGGGLTCAPLSLQVLLVRET